MMPKKTYFTSLKEHIARVPLNPVYYKDKIPQTPSTNFERLTSPATQTSGNKRSYITTIENGQPSPSGFQMSFYHKDSDKKYTYLKRQREDDPVLSPKQVVSVYFDQNTTID
jgi:hypothetical protein